VLDLQTIATIRPVGVALAQRARRRRAGCFSVLFLFSLSVFAAPPTAPPGSDTALLQEMNSRLDDVTQGLLYTSLFVAFALGFHKGGQR